MKELTIVNKVADYIFDNYSQDDSMRLAKIKFILNLSMSKEEPSNWKDLIDKIAALNGINKIKREPLKEPPEKTFMKLAEKYKLTDKVYEDGLRGGNLTKDIAQEMFKQLDMTPIQFASQFDEYLGFSGSMCMMVENWVKD